MTDVAALLIAARADPSVCPILADAIRDDDGDTPAVAAVLGRPMRCEWCGCPEMTGRKVCMDRSGKWRDCQDADVMSRGEVFQTFGPDYLIGRGLAEPTVGTLTFYRLDYWHLVCPHCRRSLVAKRAAATRKANRSAATEAEPNLFAGVE